MSALLGGLLVLAQAASPVYPISLKEPDFAAAAPFRLVDLRYELSDTFSSEHAFLARVRVKDRGYLGASFRGEQRSLTLQTQRLELALGGREGATSLAFGYRAPRFLLSTAAERITASGERGTTLQPALSVRLSPDLELLGSLAGDSRRSRFLRSGSLGLLWQRGTWWEATGEYAHARLATATDENTRDTGALALLAQLGPAEVSGGVLVDDDQGRFPHRQLELDLGLRLSLRPRLLLEGGARHRRERGAGERSHHYDGALTWFARRFHLPRQGQAAERSVALARRATGLGYNERRSFDTEERRAQRERLSLSKELEQLRGELLASYRSQVEERAVPLLGMELVDEADELAGTETRIVRVLLGLPWPPAWPWRTGPDSVPFLRLDLEQERVLSGPAYRSTTETARLTASLNRELDLQVSWSRIAPTPLDLIRGIGRRRTLTASLVYAHGR